MTNFDNVHSRLNTNSVKWDSIATTYKEEGLLPLWVADMDFWHLSRSRMPCSK